jgi:hypothetical protein
MENVIIFISDLDGSENVIIDKGNGEITGMSKATYDAQVEHLTEIPTPPAE